jgi:hypothetical protein
LSAVRDCLFTIFVATLHIWRPFLHLQPEDMRCHGDRGGISVIFQIYFLLYAVTVVVTNNAFMNNIVEEKLLYFLLLPCNISLFLV